MLLSSDGGGLRKAELVPCELEPCDDGAAGAVADAAVVGVVKPGFKKPLLLPLPTSPYSELC